MGNDSGGYIIHHGDCLDVMRSLPSTGFDCVITDPPYGIGKADWDTSFDSRWLSMIPRLTNKLGLMPGVWNLLDCPKDISGLVYKWTLAGHLTNGMTRGAMGFGNWIPCLVYERRAHRADVAAWCVAFADWCDQAGVSKKDLSRVTDTSDMGGWWASRIPHRSQVPSFDQWQKIKNAFDPPDSFDALVQPSDYEPIGDCRDFAVGSEKKPNHPSPKPLNVMVWIVESLTKPGDLVLDPFCGSGTTGLACVLTGRRFVGIELEAEYVALARERIKNALAQPKLFAPQPPQTEQLAFDLSNG